MVDKVEDLNFLRDESFESLYSNNVQIETSVWDLKMVFGEIDQGKGLNAILQHTAVTVGWAEAKVLAYFLLVNLVVHQAREGPIAISRSVVPPRPDPSKPELDEDSKKVVLYLAWLHDLFFTDNVGAPPTVTGNSATKKL